jgi:hypothetical protein
MLFQLLRLGGLKLVDFLLDCRILSIEAAERFWMSSMIELRIVSTGTIPWPRDKALASCRSSVGFTVGTGCHIPDRPLLIHPKAAALNYWRAKTTLCQELVRHGF